MHNEHIVVREVEGEKEDKRRRDDVSVPRDFLQAWVLLLLRNWQAHGYALLSALANAGFPDLNHSVLYRELRALEEKGFLSSFWDTAKSGPARRTYVLTEAGERVLGAWAKDIEQYQRQFSKFLGDYFKAWGAFSKPEAESKPRSTDGGPE